MRTKRLLTTFVLGLSLMLTLLWLLDEQSGNASASPAQVVSNVTQQLPTVVATLELSAGVGLNPLAIAANPANGYVYVANTSDEVTIISGTQAIDVIPVGKGPHAVAANPTTGYVYVANHDNGANNVTVL